MRKKKWHSKRMVFHDDDWQEIQDAAKIVRKLLDKPYLKLPTCVGFMAKEVIGTYGMSDLQEEDFSHGAVDLENADNVYESGPAGSKGKELERR